MTANYIDVDVHKVDKYGNSAVKPKRQGQPRRTGALFRLTKSSSSAHNLEEPSTRNATQVKAREKVPKENAGKTLPLHTHHH